MSSGISIILPTIGHESLARTLESIKRNKHEQFTVLLGVDRNLDSKLLDFIVKTYAKYESCINLRIIWCDGPKNDWGISARLQMLPRVETTHVAWIDDDDIYLPKSLEVIARDVGERPFYVHLYRVRWFDIPTLIWHSAHKPFSALKDGYLYNITPQCVVHPKNLPTPNWDHWHSGEVDFFDKMFKDLPRSHMVWHPDVTAHVRPYSAAEYLDKPE